MKSATLFLAGLSLVSYVAGASLHDSSIASRHRRLSGRSSEPVPALVNSTSQLSRRRESKRCKPRETESPKPDTGNVNVDAGNNNSNNNNNNNNGGGSVYNGEGLIRITSSNCGSPRASKSISATEGPNGAQSWLNCGIDDGGWTPPMVTVDDIVTVSLETAGDTFAPCADFVWIFEKYGAKYNIPPIMLASFAMQESTCNPETVGGGDEQGLMQLTPDKCGGAPGGNCREPEFNIRTGAKFFSDVLAQNGGNVLKAAGHYNGWYERMTKWDAMKAANSACCRCQQNLDYLHQFFNGWLQGKNAYDHTLRLGSYFNLDVCL